MGEPFLTLKVSNNNKLDQSKRFLNSKNFPNVVRTPLLLKKDFDSTLVSGIRAHRSPITSYLFIEVRFFLVSLCSSALALDQGY